MKKLLVVFAFAPVLASAQVPSSPSLGIAEGRCRAGEPGPAFLINVVGLKDRGGTMKAELYPANDNDFLADDNILINAGKTFRRVVIDVPSSGNVQLCIRAPSAGTYGLSLLHDRDGNRKGVDERSEIFSLRPDIGIIFQRERGVQFIAGDLEDAENQEER